MAGRCEIVVHGSAERVLEFIHIFGTTRLPVTGPERLVEFPQRRRLPAFLLDMAALSSDQRARLVAHVSQQTGSSIDDVEAALDMRGLPIQGAWCTLIREDA